MLEVGNTALDETALQSSRDDGGREVSLAVMGGRSSEKEQRAGQAAAHLRILASWRQGRKD